MRAGRLPARTGDGRADAIRELRWAMAGAGLTVDKVPMMAAVLELPAVAAALRGVPPASAPTVAMAVLTAALRGLGEGVHARMLRNALAVDYSGDAKDLTARRLEFVAAHNAAAREEGSRNLLGETTRASYDVEQRMLAALVTALGSPPDAPSRPGARASVAAVAGETPWMSAEQDITLRLSGRASREAEVVHVLRSLVDDLAEFSVSYYCDETNDGGGTRFHLFEGGTVEEDRAVGRPSFRTARIRFPAPLRSGQTHRVRYNTTYSAGPSPEPFLTLVVVRPIELGTIRVAFDRAELPARVWRIDGLIPAAGAGDPEDAEPLIPDSTGQVATSFASPQIGFAYGIAWEWPA